MINDPFASVKNELAATRTRLLAEFRKVEAAEKALGVDSAPTPSLSPAKSSKPAKPRGKAPAGALNAAIKLVVSRTPWLTNAEIRADLKKSGYAHNASSGYVSKALSLMKKAGELVTMDAERGTVYAATGTPPPTP